MAVPLWLVSLLLPLTVVAVPQQDPIQQTGADFKIVVESTEPSRRLSSPMQEPRAVLSGGWDLTGTWLDQDNGVYVVTQFGSTVTWSAHSSDNRQWGHKFTGTISGDVVEGDFQDVPPYMNRLSGHIKLRIVDATHMTLVSSSGPFGARSWTRQTPVPPNASLSRPTTPPAREVLEQWPGSWNLTGTWLDEASAVYVVTQSGSTVTWSAHSADNRLWGHTFTGAISGNIVEGDYEDVPPYLYRNKGHLTLRIVDATHMALVSGPSGARSWTRQTPVPPNAIPTATPAPAAPTAVSSSVFNLTGTWLDQTNGVYVVTQSGSTVTWTAHSADNRQWGHNFTGTINGDIVEGDFQDVPPYTNRLSGHIKVRVVDINHMTLTSASGSFGANSWTRQPAVLLHIPRVAFPWSTPL
jgi:hypothetical protein